MPVWAESLQNLELASQFKNSKTNYTANLQVIYFFFANYPIINKINSPNGTEKNNSHKSNYCFHLVFISSV